MSPAVRPVLTKKEKSDFLLLPWDLHKSDPNWVPPLLLSVQQNLDTKCNPFYKHAKLKQWSAYRENKCVGRIAGIIGDRHNEFHQEKVAFWGFFECENNFETAQKLFHAVEEWAKNENMTFLRGPMSPSTNHECGLQVSAFETRPFIMMTQNPAYYAELIEKSGFSKVKDLYAWLVDSQCKFDERLIRHAKRLEKSAGITFRHIDMKHFNEEVESILEIYNDAWEKNWGFVPMTDEEFRYMAKEMKAVVIPELLFIVEVKGESAGFGLFLPDLNQVMIKIRNGKLFPTGLLKLLWHTKFHKTMTQGRILTLGVKKKFHHLGLGSLMYLKYFETGPRLGFPSCECSWILEDNAPMNHGLKYMNAKHYKTYRIYEKPILV